MSFDFLNPKIRTSYGGVIKCHTGGIKNQSVAFLTGKTWWVTLVEQELLTFPKHLSSWHLWLVIVLSVLLRSIYGLALPLRYLQNFLGSKLKCLIDVVTYVSIRNKYCNNFCWTRNNVICVMMKILSRHKCNNTILKYYDLTNIKNR